MVARQMDLDMRFSKMKGHRVMSHPNRWNVMEPISGAFERVNMNINSV
jgi:hypothetical protein